MLTSLRARLALTYFLVALLVIAACDVLMYRSVEMAYFQQLQSETFQNLFASAAAAQQIDRPEVIRPVVKSLAASLSGRALITDSLGRVQADSLDDGGFLGKVLTVDEVLPAISGKAASSVYRMESQSRFLYAAVPIEASRKVVGSLLVAVPLAGMDRRLARLLPDIIRDSLWIALLAALVSYLLSARMTAPIKRLVAAFESAPLADYRHRLPAKGRGELQRLSRAFNVMADRLQRTEQARRDFVVDAAHEIAEPLARIAETAQDTSVPPAQRLRDIGLRTDDMSQAVSDLLELASLEMDTDPLRLETLDFSSLMNEVIAYWSAAIPIGQAEVRRDDRITEALSAQVDRGRMRLAVSGLIRYFVAAIPPNGSVRLSLSCDVANLLFSVTGSGHVISDEDLPFIFERFLARRARAGDDFLPETTGAGLAIARRVIELHGGVIEAKTTADGGVAFFARVPRGSIS